MLCSHNNKIIMKPLKTKMLIYFFIGCFIHLFLGVNSQVGYERIQECQVKNVMVRDARGTLHISVIFAWPLMFELLCQKGNSWRACKLPDQKTPATLFFFTLTHPF